MTVEQEIGERRKLTRTAMAQAMSLDSLSTRIYGQMLSYMQQKVRKISDLPCYAPKSSNLDKKSKVEKEEAKGLYESYSSLDKARPSVKEKQLKHSSVLDNMIKTNVFRETLRSSIG